MLTKNIEFYCDPNIIDAIPHPQAASKFIPEWYKTMPNDTESNPASIATVKRCIPFLDSMRAGYIIPLWQDFHFKHSIINQNDQIYSQWMTSLDTNGAPPIDNHFLDQIKGTPFANKRFGKYPMKFNGPWTIKTPPGYSCLITSPLNQENENFGIFTAIVDTDTYFDKLNFPFIWKAQDFDGIIERGTPLVQVIPFRREDWKSEIKRMSYNDSSKLINNREKVKTVFKKGYRKFFWQQKKFR